MLEQIHAALSDIAQGYRDTRIYHCQVEAIALEGDRCLLSGTVLDAETLAVVTAGLAVRLPAVTFDTDGVKVLRTDAPQLLTVGTNVTGLHAEPSFQAEMASQLLNGWVVERLLEREGWAHVRQADGYLGWAYRPYLVGTPAPAPTHIVCAPVSLLRGAPDLEAALVSRLLVGTAVQVSDMLNPPQGVLEEGWGWLALAGGLEGWVPMSDLRALDRLPQDPAAQRRQMVQDAARLTGVPYLWGGCTALGIDCSGMAQLLHRLVGLTIPRDADMQYDAGQPLEPPFQPGDLLFFGGEGGGRSITHVGISLGGWRIVHSSRARNGVYEDDVQAVEHLRERFVGARTFL
jgi:cell wall-associated NlpC family hydrolase